MSYITLEHIRIYFKTSNLISEWVNHEDNELSDNKFAFVHFSVSSQKEVNRKNSESRPFKYAIVCRCMCGIGGKADTENFLN